MLFPKSRPSDNDMQLVEVRPPDLIERDAPSCRADPEDPDDDAADDEPAVGRYRYPVVVGALLSICVVGLVIAATGDPAAAAARAAAAAEPEMARLDGPAPAEHAWPDGRPLTPMASDLSGLQSRVEARRAADPSSDAVGDDRGATATDAGAPDGGLPSRFSPAP